MKKLTDDGLESVSGGITRTPANTMNTQPKKTEYCPKCETERTFYLYSGGRAICSTCGKEIMM